MMIRLENVSKWYLNDGKQSEPVLYELNLTIPDRQFVCILGPSGCGKTTLLNHILTAQHGKRIAVIENEFSAGLGIEGMIAKSGMDGENISDFVELTNGCICCSIKGDLLITLEKLVMHKNRFDYIIIETTGLANPGPVISSFWSDDAIMSSVKLDGVICLVDCLNIGDYLTSADIAGDVHTQICYSDRILLNKTDLVAAERIPGIEQSIRQLNSIAEMRCSKYSNVDLDFVLNINGYTAGAAEAEDVNRVIQCVPCVPPAAPAKKGAATEPAAAAAAPAADWRGLMQIKQDVAGSAPHLASVLMTHSIKLEGTFMLKPLEIYQRKKPKMPFVMLYWIKKQLMKYLGSLHYHCLMKDL